MNTVDWNSLAKQTKSFCNANHHPQIFIFCKVEFNALRLRLLLCHLQSDSFGAVLVPRSEETLWEVALTPSGLRKTFSQLLFLGTK